MPESTEEWYARVHAAVARDGYRSPPWSGSPSWPFDGELAQRPLGSPGSERPRGGEGGTDCFMCRAEQVVDRDYLVWRDEVAMVGLPLDPVALPFAAFLMPRRHADLQDLDPGEAARLGELLALTERAACRVLDVPRIQVMRWGEGQEHLHWWLMARPTGAEQLRGGFLALWDDLLPTRPPEALRRDVELVCRELVGLAGGEAITRSP